MRVSEEVFQVVCLAGVFAASLSRRFIHRGGPHLSVPSGQSTIWDSLTTISLAALPFEFRPLGDISGTADVDLHVAL